MKRYADGKLIKRLEKKLYKVLADMYANPDGLYCEVDKVEYYFTDGPCAFMEICYGVENNADGNWDRKVELPLADGKNIDFILGQFYQAIWQTENK